MKRYFILFTILIAFCFQVYGQKTKHPASEKWITTAIDSFLYASPPSTLTHLTVTSDSLSQNLLRYYASPARVGTDTAWRTLLPSDACYTYPATGGIYLYRKAKKDSVYSRAWAD